MTKAFLAVKNVILYHRGQRIEGRLILGDVVKGTNKLFFVVVKGRDPEALMPLI